MTPLEYIIERMEKSGIFGAADFMPDIVKQYADSYAIAKLPGSPIETRYTRGEKDVNYGFTITFRHKSITEEMRIYSNSLFDTLAEWMEIQNRLRLQQPPIDEGLTFLSWRALDSGFTLDQDLKDDTSVYQIQCALIYHKEAII